MPRILGLDYGEKRLGFAVSDPTGMLATPLRVETCRSEDEAAKIVAEVCAETGAGQLVVGLPLNMDGSRGPQALKVLAFVERMKGRLSMPVTTWDERLSSRAAERVLIDAGTSRKGRRGVVDKLAAQIFLQSYLDAQFPGVPDYDPEDDTGR